MSTPTSIQPSASGTRLGLGLDAGGTKTRWAICDATGATLAEGEVGGFSGLQLGSGDGRAHIQSLLAELAAACTAHGSVGAVCAGITGFDGDAAPTMAALAGAELDVPVDQVLLFNDIELACHAAFAPGEGYLVYAGTGSVAAFVDARGVLHRAGGHGVIIDDAGGGYWIAVQALRHIWRAEDESPGAWQRSALARSMFATLGGSDWALTRHAIYGGSRGDVGRLALAVARVADEDATARAILEAAGAELARLARALTGRLGARPVALAGRVFELHPSIEASLRRLLPSVELRPRSPLHAHQQAARMAAALAASAGSASR